MIKLCPVGGGGGNRTETKTYRKCIRFINQEYTHTSTASSGTGFTEGSGCN